MKYFSLSHLVAILAVLIATVGQVQAAVITIDFDGFTPTNTFLGGVEDGFIVGSISGPVAVNGDFLGPRSGINSIHHGLPGLASFSLSSVTGERFTLSSFFAGSAFSGGDPLTLTGYLNGSVVGIDVFDPNPPNSYMSFTPINLSGVVMDFLVFDMGPAVPGPSHIDDIELNTVPGVPEPTSMAIFGLGALTMAYRTRRKSKA
jgi:hypothetical protein